MFSPDLILVTPKDLIPDLIATAPETQTASLILPSIPRDMSEYMLAEIAKGNYVPLIASVAIVVAAIVGTIIYVIHDKKKEQKNKEAMEAKQVTQ